MATVVVVRADTARANEWGSDAMKILFSPVGLTNPGSTAARRPLGVRKRVLIVNVFFDDFRRTTGSPYKVPQAMGPAYLAGAFSRELCDVRLYNEQSSGSLHDMKLLGWPDMLVLTGLTLGFDRMLHLTAYARTLNEKVIVVAGGPAVRALPRYSRRFFDYACVGDIEQLQLIAREAFGEAYVAHEMFPRFDLVNSPGRLGYVESSRYCNFRCSFCSLTGESNRYQKYDLDYIRRQILSVERSEILFIDNNFYGNDRKFFLDRMALLKGMHQKGQLKGWAAILTADFFLKAENLELAREAGCKALFSGVESFDRDTLLSYNKRQNIRMPQVEMIRGCLESGIAFHYGVMLDVTARRLVDLGREIEFIVDSPEISLPTFFTLAIPLLGTPYFKDCLKRGLFLPNVRLRDLDGLTIAMRPLDPLDEAANFVRDMSTLRRYRGRVARHAVNFYKRYRRTLGTVPMMAALASAALICAPCLVTSPGRMAFRRARRTYIATTEFLDPQYTPILRVAARFEKYFRPTLVTDETGGLACELAEDLGDAVAGHPAEVIYAGRQRAVRRIESGCS